MKNQEKKDFKETFPHLGVGPKILLALCPFLIIFGILNLSYYSIFKIPIEYYWLFMIGSILIISGFFIFIYSEKIMRSAYNESVLGKIKTYAYVRHPMYSIWGFTLLPGIFFLLNSWFYFFILPIYYLLVRLFIRKEEKYLLRKFGDDYVKYKKSVNAFFPKIRKYKPE